MRNQVNKPKSKQQYNKPKYADGQEMPILKSGGRLYLRDELEAVAKNRGYKNGIQPYEDFRYDSYWATRDPDSRILVSVAGEVAQWFPAKNDYGGGYKILAQEWKQEYLPEQKEVLAEIYKAVEEGYHREDLLSLVKHYQMLDLYNQKYLWVYLRDAPEFPTRGALNPLHKIVAELHCDVTEQIVTECGDGRFMISGSLNTEHLDCRKDNNSIHNLRLTTGTINQRMRMESLEDKLALYDSHAPIGKLWELRDLLEEMMPTKPTQH